VVRGGSAQGCRWQVSRLTMPVPWAGRPSVMKLVNYYTAANLDDWATYDDSSHLVLVIVVGAALVDVGPASVFFGLAWGQTAILPTCFLAVAPSRGTSVAISVDTILVSVATVPSLIVISIVVFVSVIFVLVSVIGHQRRRAQPQCGSQAEYCQQTLGHVSSPLLRI
jgi:hypothetical protein